MSLEIKNRNSIAKLLEPKLFYIKYLPDTFSQLDDFQEGYNSYIKLSKSKPIKVIVEMSKNASVSSDARQFAEGNKIKATAEAVILHSAPQRLVFKVYSKVRKQEHPLKVCKSFKEAKEWIDSID